MMNAQNDKELDVAESGDVEEATDSHADSDDVETGLEEDIDVNKPGDSKPEKAGGKSHKGLYTILILLLIGAAALISPDRFKALFKTLSEKAVPAQVRPDSSQQAPVQQTPVQQAPAQQSVRIQTPVVHVAPQSVRAVAPKPEPQIKKTTAPQKPAVNSEEVQHLLDTINNLRGELGQLGGELGQLSDDQQKLRSALHEQQLMNLQVRLRWVTDPAARLPQMKLAWEEISLLPGLSDDQRATAVQMHALAQSGVERLQKWRIAMKKWADALAVPAHEDILPQPEHPWLAWLMSQFHLRQAPNLEVRKLTDMRNRLLETSRLLILESWPEAGEWQSLRAELILQIKAHAKDQAAPVDLGLPDSFSAIQQDIESLRQNAHDWLEQY